jgi:YHS domain-containing protein
MNFLKVFLLIFFITGKLFSQDLAIRKKEFLLNNGIGISGYDPTSYFSNKPQKGRKEYSYIYEGIKYLFVNANNQNAFIKNPTKFEPQYGGWCAYAMGNKGEKIEIDPETFKIIEGKLYLFFHPFYKNTLREWNKDEKQLKQKADNYWTKIIKNR